MIDAGDPLGLSDELGDGPRRLPTPAADAAESFRIPQLQLWHIMLWVTLAAVLLKVQATAVFQQNWGVAPRLLAGGGTVIRAATIAGFFVLLSAWRRGAARQLEPGHWLIAATAPASAVWYLIWTLEMAFRAGVSHPGDGQSWLGDTMFATYTVLNGFEGATCVAAASFQRSYWRAILALQGAVRLLIAASGFAFLLTVDTHAPTPVAMRLLAVTVSPLWNFGFAGLIALGVVADLVHRAARRDWLHWTGIVAMLTEWTAGFLLVRALST